MPNHLTLQCASEAAPQGAPGREFLWLIAGDFDQYGAG